MILEAALTSCGSLQTIYYFCDGKHPQLATLWAVRPHREGRSLSFLCSHYAHQGYLGLLCIPDELGNALTWT